MNINDQTEIKKKRQGLLIQIKDVELRCEINYIQHKNTLVRYSLYNAITCIYPFHAIITARLECDKKILRLQREFRTMANEWNGHLDDLGYLCGENVNQVA